MPAERTCPGRGGGGRWIEDSIEGLTKRQCHELGFLFFSSSPVARAVHISLLLFLSNKNDNTKEDEE